MQQGSVIFSALADDLLKGVDLSCKLQVGAGVDLSVGNNQSITIEDVLEGGSLFAPFAIANANPGNINADYSKVYTPYITGNSDKVDHIRLLGDNTFGFEDLAGGGDRDFNDMVVKASFQVV